MSAKSFVLDTMRKQGRTQALALQEKAPAMTGTELNAESDYIPQFKEARKIKNMLNRKAGQEDGFICQSEQGRVVRLIQNYNSDTYPAEPEDLPAHWRFVWSKDPAHALPFFKSSESYYMIGDCCLWEGIAKRSKNDYNTYSPAEYPEAWEVAT